jgi:hypothetical protein
MLVGDDPERVKEAFQSIAEDRNARLAFQEAFANLDKDRSRHPSRPHDSLVRLIHSGFIQLTISLNWDTLLESAWKQLYGTSINQQAARLYKPHGDAQDPQGVWVFPGEPGYISEEIIKRVSALTEERPRTLMVIGYSEQDEIIVNDLIKPLSDRWRVIRIGPSAVGEGGIPLPAETALPILADHLCPEPQVSGWAYITFANQTGLAPAIAGRRLGPANVVACPHLPQVDKAYRQLELVHIVDITGPAGCGKSISAYQVAYGFLQLGWEVLRPVQPVNSERVLLESAFALKPKSVLIIDDGQLFTTEFVTKLREFSSHDRKVIMTITDPDADTVGSIHISNSMAIETLASAYRDRRDEVLPIVRSFDKRVSDGYSATPIEWRIDEASKADMPWQFNFILRGGWNQAKDEIRILRDFDRSDLLLIAVAIRQILYLDRGVPLDLISLCSERLGRKTDWAHKSLKFLVKRKAVISEDAVRCPHIRFAVVALESFLTNIGDSEVSTIVRFIREELCEELVPLRGIYWLLDRLRFLDTFRFPHSNQLITEDIWQKLVGRCLDARNPTERGSAAFLLDALAGWLEHGHERLITHQNTIARWVECADDSSTSGIARLINNLYNENHGFASSIVSQVCPEIFAERLRFASHNSAYGWGDLLGKLALTADDAWRKRFAGALDREHCKEFVKTFVSGQTSRMGQFIYGIRNYDSDLAFDLLDLGLPIIEASFAQSPLIAWENIRDTIWFLLGHIARMFRDRTPDKRQREYSRKIAHYLPTNRIAVDLSHSRQYDWERYAELLGWLHDIDKNRYREIIHRVDIRKLDSMTEGLWPVPPRELRLLISSLAADKEGEPAKSWVKSHEHEITTADPIVSRIAPEVAISIFKRGGCIDLFGHNGNSWSLAGLALIRIYEVDHCVVSSIIKANSRRIAKAVSELQFAYCDDLPRFLDLIRELDSESIIAIFSSIDVDTAEKNWTLRLKEKTKAVRTVAKLVSIAKQCDGNIAEFARRLELRVPKRFRDVQ